MSDDDLHGNFSAAVWAERFVQRVTDKPEIATDEGAMLAWFAGAIMTGFDHHAATEGGLWLVVDGNRVTVSVFGNEAAAEDVVAKMQDSHPQSDWRVERWAIR